MTVETVLVSVVIPTRNRSELVVKALDSVKRQSVRPLEIIVVDDGSTDDTQGAVETWSTENAGESLTLRLVAQQNLGANAARNAGIRHAAGKYVAFLDSDDSWLPGKLDKQLVLPEGDEELGGVYCGLRTVDLDTGEITSQPPRSYPSGRILSQMLIHDVSNPTSCWIVRRNCFDRVGVFDVDLPARQDWDMWIRLAAEYAIGAVPEALVEMGEHSGERVRTDPNREIEAHKMIFAKYADLRARLPRRVSLAARSAMYRRRGRVCLHRKGQRMRAAGLQALAILVWPFSFDSYAALLGTVLPKKLRRKLNVIWNAVFGKTPLAIKSH